MKLFTNLIKLTFLYV